MSEAILTARKASTHAAAWLGALLAALFLGRLLLFAGPSVTFGFLAIIALLLVVLTRPAYGALVLAAAVPAVSGLRRGIPIPGFRPSEVIIVLVATVVLLVVASRGEAVPWRTFDWLALLYVVANIGLGSFDLVRRGDPFSLEAVGELLGPLQFFLVYRAVLSTVRTSDLRANAIRYMLLASIPVSMLGIAQTLDLGPTRKIVASLTGVDLTTAYGYESLPRATGPFPIWHALGGYLFLVILVGLALYLDPSTTVIGRRTLLFTLGLASAALVATATIAPIAGVLLGAIVLGFWFRRISKLFVIIATALVALTLIFGPLLTSRYDQQYGTSVTFGHRPDYVPQTVWARYLIWHDQYVPALERDDRWLSGYGPGVPPEVDWPYTETLYVTLLMRGGIVLLAVYGFLMVALAVQARPYTRSPDPVLRAVGRVIYLSVFLIAVMHGVANYFVITGFPHVLWPLLGLLFAPDLRTSVQKASSKAERSLKGLRPAIGVGQD